MRLIPLNMLKPSSSFTDRSKAVLLSFTDDFCYLCFVFVCHTVPCSLVETYWKMADLLAFLYVMCFFFVLFFCVFVLFLYDVLSQVWYLIVLIPDFAVFLTLRESMGPQNHVPTFLWPTNLKIHEAQKTNSSRTYTINVIHFMSILSKDLFFFT